MLGRGTKIIHVKPFISTGPCHTSLTANWEPWSIVMNRLSITLNTNYTNTLRGVTALELKVLSLLQRETSKDYSSKQIIGKGTLFSWCSMVSQPQTCTSFPTSSKQPNDIVTGISPL